MKIAVTAALGLAFLAFPAAASAHTGSTVVCKATLSGHPENASPIWAYDDFVRVTTITPAGEGAWKAHIRDLGRFTTVPGATSDSGDTIASKVVGIFAGRGDYTVTSKSAPKCVTHEHYTGTAGPTTGQWPVHYFTDATTTGIDPWHWDYRTCREHMSEDSKAGTSGHMAGLRCQIHHRRPSPSGTPTTPAPSGSVTPSPSTSTPPGEAPAPTPVNSDLPVTG